MPIQGAERYAGPSYRFARPLNAGQARESSDRLKLTYFSPEGYRFRSWAVDSKYRIRVRLSFDDPAETSEGTLELTAHADFFGKSGPVQVPIKTERFLQDAAMLRKYVLDMARAIMEGAESHSSYRRVGSFSFHFSGDPQKSLDSLLNGFILPGRQGWNNSGRMLLFYPESQEGEVREIEIFDAWIINRIAELELASQVIDPAEIASQAGVTEKRLITQIGRIDEVRRSWGLPALPRHPSFKEIEEAVKKLRSALRKWPTLLEVAEELKVNPPALRYALDFYNQKRTITDQQPLLLL